MEPSIRVFIGLAVVVGFLYLAHALVTATDASVGEPIHSQRMRELEYSFPLIGALGLLIGAGAFYLIYSRVEPATSTGSPAKNEKPAQAAAKNPSALLKLASPEERKVIQALLDNNGRLLQSEITRLPEMTKVRSHRVIQRLIDRGVLQKEEFGKTNKVKFSPEIQEGLQ